MAITYKNLIPPSGEEVNMGGLSERLWFARKVDILTFATPAASPANPYVLTSPHIMKSGKQFYEAYVTQDTGEIDFQSIGEIDRKSYKPVLKGLYPGFEDDAILFFNQVKNDKLIVLAELPDGKIIQLGNERFSCSVSPNFKTTTNGGAGRGVEFEIVCYMPNVYRYAASVPLVPAS